MAAELKTLRVTSRQQWRAWLASHHASSPSVWLVFYKALTGVKSISIEDTNRAALCFEDRQSGQALTTINSL